METSSISGRASGFDSTLALFSATAESLVDEIRVGASRSRLGDARESRVLREGERASGLERAGAADHASRMTLLRTILSAVAEVVRGAAAILSAIGTREGTAGDVATEARGRRVAHASTVLDDVATLLDVGTGVVDWASGGANRPANDAAAPSVQGASGTSIDAEDTGDARESPDARRP